MNEVYNVEQTSVESEITQGNEWKASTGGEVWDNTTGMRLTTTTTMIFLSPAATLAKVRVLAIPLTAFWPPLLETNFADPRRIPAHARCI